MKSKVIGIYTVMILAIIFSLVPIILGITTSLKVYQEVYRVPPGLIPDPVTFKSWISLFFTVKETPGVVGAQAATVKSAFAEYFINSLIVASGVTSVTILVSLPVGYGLARFRFKARYAISVSVLLFYLLPPVVLLIPLYVVFSKLELIDTYIALSLAHTIWTLPLGIWFLRGYFVTIPWQLEEAAMIDGCTRLSAIRRIVLPISIPGVLAIALFAFEYSWGEFLYALVLTGSSTRTVPVGLMSFIKEHFIDWPGLMSGTLMFSFPVVILFFIFQKYFVAGLTGGAVKG